jgi:hypothetical protein
MLYKQFSKLSKLRLVLSKLRLVCRKAECNRRVQCGHV